MAFDGKSLDDYIDVAQRLADFRELHPEGSLQPADPAKPWELATVTGYRKDGQEFTATLIVYVAAAYRSPDDARPGIGVAWEVFPGRTPYTAGSELMNAETSAWGRAVVAALAGDSRRGVASRQEVKARQLEREDGLPINRDGSLSRSATSDEQKAAAGVMTSGQLAEHTSLQPGRGRPAERVTATAPDDPWYDNPAMPGGGAVAEAEDRPGSIDRRQLQAVMAVFGRLGITDRVERLEWSRRALGLAALGSSNELSFRQGGELLAALRDAEQAGPEGGQP